jgi:UDP-glucose 4-epimerase
MMKSLAGARVLVTRSSGFLGSHICARLLAEGAEVHASSRRRVPRDPASGRRGNRSGVRLRHVNLEDPAAVRRLLPAVRPDVILHGHLTRPATPSTSETSAT